MPETNPEKPITSTKIPGTNVPDVTKVDGIEAETKRFMSWVAVTTAILATMASIASMFSTSHLNQAMLDQIKSANQWAYFQAKGVKLAVLESKMELVGELGKTAKPEDAERAERYKREQDEIRAEAAAREISAGDHRTRHITLGRASTAYQVAIALAAIALLVRRRILWHLSMALGLVGTVFFVLGMA
ncbi:MAG: DUF4337 domain-containing protein [Tepidisphaera sp.]